MLEDKDREIQINKEDLGVKSDLNANLREDLHRSELEYQDLQDRKRGHVTEIERLRETHHFQLRENDNTDQKIRTYEDDLTRAHA